MSANNLLRIKKINHTGTPVFLLEEIDADTNQRIGRHPLGIFNNLEKAIKSANDYMEIEDVEYGLDIRI